MFGHDYDRDKAYAEDIEASNINQTTKQKQVLNYATTKNITAAQGSIIADSTGNKTGKLNMNILK